MKKLAPYVTARLLYQEVTQLALDLNHEQYTSERHVISLKHMLIALSKIQELEKMLRPLYKENNDLSKGYKELRPGLQFIEYLRSKFAGHALQELVEKTIEWRPETKCFVALHDNENMPWLLDMFLLETAINTYVDKDDNHKIFDGNTDIAYPENRLQFFNFIDEIVESSTSYLESIIEFFKIHVTPISPEELPLGDYVKAATTDFGYLRKGKK